MLPDEYCNISPIGQPTTPLPEGNIPPWLKSSPDQKLNAKSDESSYALPFRHSMYVSQSHIRVLIFIPTPITITFAPSLLPLVSIITCDISVQGPVHTSS